jgi:16S rRNA (adenine1518-N6/adenine1519-N6)-dimethyltransferase
VGLQSIRDTLQRNGLRLSRDLGQNFLVEDAVAERLAQLSGAGHGDGVIEVGTGLGVLTRALAARAQQVVTIEIDSGLVGALVGEELLPANVELIHADALELDFAALANDLVGRDGVGSLRIVANLPYSVASPLLRKLLDLADTLMDWSVMLQKELADRLVAEPGTRDYGSLTVLHHLVAHVETEMDLQPGCFFPAPKVASSFVRIFPRGDCPLAVDELPQVERVVRAVFNQRRKTILNGLKGGGLPKSGDKDALVAALAAANIDPKARAETLAPETLLDLSRALAE